MVKHKLKAGKVGEKVIGAYKKIEDSFVDSFLEKSDETENGYTLKSGKIGENIVNNYKSIEEGVVGTYKKIENKFVDAFLEEVGDDSEEAENSNGLRPRDM